MCFIPNKSYPVVISQSVGKYVWLTTLYCQSGSQTQQHLIEHVRPIL